MATQTQNQEQLIQSVLQENYWQEISELDWFLVFNCIVQRCRSYLSFSWLIGYDTEQYLCIICSL